MKNIKHFFNIKVLMLMYLIAVHVFIVVYRKEIVFNIKHDIGIYSENNDLNSQHHRILMTFYGRVDKNTQSDSIIFVGDSLIQGLAVSAVHNNSVNFGIGNDTTVGVLSRLKQYSSILNSKAVVISVGINDLKYRSNTEILKNYKEILEIIPDNIPVLINSILPVNEIISNNKAYNSRLLDLNKQLKNLCSQNDRLYFLDMTKFLINSDGNLSGQYHVGDGVHLNRKGNSIWILKLKESLSTII